MRTQTAFRLEKNLLNQLKKRAQEENRSLNNLVETILLENVNPSPSEKEIEFMAKWDTALSGKELKNRLSKHIDSLPWQK